jgi:hypothetical protein
VKEAHGEAAHLQTFAPKPNTTMRFALTMASIKPSSAFSGMAANTPARSLSAPFDNWARVSVIASSLVRVA